MGRIEANGSFYVKNSGFQFTGFDGEDENQVVTFNKDFGAFESTDLSKLGPMPAGGIIMWSGPISTIPKYWFLCNGQEANGRTTPDLSGRFIVGAEEDGGNAPGFDPATGVISGTYGQGAIGGQVAVSLTAAQIPTEESDPSTEGVGITSSTNETSGAQYHENRPPYFALAYIMYSPDSD